MTSPISRRSLLMGSAALAGASIVGFSGNAEAARRLTRPTGPEYVRYEDLYRRGDTVGGALARLRSPKIVTFPEGKFECSDFNSGFQAGISVPAICRGIVGSGRGTLDGSTGTVFTIKRMSSRKGNGARDENGRRYVPPQDNSTPCQLNILKQLNQRAPAVWRYFQVAGTEQGHVFSAFQVYNTAGANSFEDILITGWDGNAGAPPGETSALAVNGRGAHTLAGVEVDGRRTPGGEVYGAMGITVQNTVGAKLNYCYAHHCRAAGFVAFQSVAGVMRGCLSDARVPADRAVGNGGINLERSAQWTLRDVGILGRPQKVHITHSNDHWTLRQGDRSYPVSNGALTLVNPTYNDLWGDHYLYIQSWTPYWNGDSMRTAPTVLRSGGKKHLTYKWVHEKHHLVG